MNKQQDTILEVDGMSCPSCIRHVSSVLELDGVDKVDVVLRDGIVVVKHDAARTSVGELIDALTAGYVSNQRPA